jgi:hypothetical protein
LILGYSSKRAFWSTVVFKYFGRFGWGVISTPWHFEQPRRYQGVIFSLSSLFGAFLAFAVLSELFTMIQMLAGLVMVLGIYILYRCRERKPK